MALKPQPKPDDYLLEVTRTIKKTTERGKRARCQTAVTLRRRFRGRSKSDQLGYFSPNGTNAWLGDNQGDEEYMNLHVLNITKPTVRANLSAMVSARVQCKAEPTRKDLRLRGAAEVANGIYEWLNDNPEHWSDVLESRVNQMIQLEFGVFIKTDFDRKARGADYNVEEWNDQDVPEAGEAVCSACAKRFPLEATPPASPTLATDPLATATGDVGQPPTEPAAGSMAPVKCRYCGEPAEVLTAAGQSTVKMPHTQSYTVGKPTTEVVSSFEVACDESKSQGGNIRGVEWLEYSTLIPEDELQSLYEDFDIGTPVEWSYPIKWKMALETGDDAYLKRWSSNQDNAEKEFEVRRIYLRPKRYRSYRSPVDWQMTDGKGRVVCSLRKGEGFVDKYPNGFYFDITGEKILPCFEACDLQQHWTYITFMPDSASFHGQPCTEILQLQDDTNNAYTIGMAQVERGSIQTTVFDREWFEASDFEYDLAPTKEGIVIEGNDDIRHHFAAVEPTNMTAPMAATEFILSQVPNTVGVQTAMYGGEGDSKDEPYAKYALRRQASLGLLTPSQQSKASGKCSVLRHHLRLAQLEQPMEWFQEIGTQYGQEWRQQDIQAFLECDIEKDLRIYYVEGSEIPTTLIERELRFRQFMQDMTEMAAALQRPDLISLEMLSQSAQYAGVDYDIGNVEADQRLANSRYEKIKEHLRILRGNLPPQFPLVVLTLADPDLTPLPKETHATHIEFYVDQERALAAEDEVDRDLIQCCEMMIGRHERAQVQSAQNTSADALASRAPEVAAQQMMQNAQAGQEAGAQQAQQEQERQAAAQSAERDREHKSAEAARDRQHEAEQSDRDRQAQLTQAAMDNIAATEQAKAKPQPSAS